MLVRIVRSLLSRFTYKCFLTCTEPYIINYSTLATFYPVADPSVRNEFAVIFYKAVKFFARNFCLQNKNIAVIVLRVHYNYLLESYIEEICFTSNTLYWRYIKCFVEVISCLSIEFIRLCEDCPIAIDMINLFLTIFTLQKSNLQI